MFYLYILNLSKINKFLKYLLPENYVLDYTQGTHKNITYIQIHKLSSPPPPPPPTSCI